MVPFFIQSTGVKSKERIVGRLIGHLANALERLCVFARGNVERRQDLFGVDPVGLFFGEIFKDLDGCLRIA